MIPINFNNFVNETRRYPYFSALYDKDMWMDDYNKIKKELLAFEKIKRHKLLNYVLKNPKCAKMYGLSQDDILILQEAIK